jgi:hypothetical protein
MIVDVAGRLKRSAFLAHNGVDPHRGATTVAGCFGALVAAHWPEKC